jgi:tetratricopeptide (TPR) repeat protein
VHRDIKPSNIIFVGGVPKLADVGLVAGVDEARSYVGTEGFIPPEGPGSPPADLYSLGIVLYVMSTGKSHQDFPEPLADLAAQPDHARWLEFNAVIHQACCAKVGKRYQSAEKMHADLVRLQRGESVKRHHVWQKWLRIARRFGLGTIAVALAAAMVILLWQTINRHSPPALQSASEDGNAATLSAEAAEAYKVGIPGLGRGTPQGFRVALENFSAAIEADPKFVAAHARLFETYLMSEDYDVPFIDGKAEKLNELSARLLKVAPTNAETHAALAIVHFLNEWKWPEAEAEFQHALKADGNCRMALTYYGYFLTRQLRVSEAHAVLERARALYPNSPLITKFLGHCEFAQRHYEKALSSYQQASVLDPNYPSAYYWAGRAYFGLTNYPQGLAELEQHELKQGSDTAWTQECYRSYRAALEQVGPQGFWSNGEILEQEEARARTPYLSYAFAMRYARAGAKQQALARLEKAFAQHDSMENLLVDEVWDEYHREPRFKHILKKVGLDAWQH